MKSIPLDLNWTYRETEWEKPQPVSLPHDAMVTQPRDPRWGNATGFFPGTDCIYEKMLAPRADWQGKTLILNIDGAYMNAGVTLNTDLLATHPYGYTPMQVDLTEHFRFDCENKLRITTANSLRNSRWYSGSGVYRQVTMLVGGRQYIHPWGVRITTPEITRESADVQVELEVTNRGEACRGELTLEIWQGDQCMLTESYPTHMLARDTVKVRHLLALREPKLWDVDEPNLYQLRFALTVDGETVDEGECTFGVRSIRIDAKRGFRLNGRSMKLRGGCIHHDNGLLGACAFPDAEERKIRILKECGYNAIRTAHNPPSAALLEACDRLGMLVLDESLDCWRMRKNALDYHMYFDAWWQQDTRAMVLRDRNHPCIYAWSIGNEIPELLGITEGAKLTAMQAEYVRTLDDRPISASANEYPSPEPGKQPTPYEPMGPTERDGKRLIGVPPVDDLWDRQTLPAIQALDMFGYNYMYARYQYDAKRHPDRVIHCTESHPFFTYDYWQAVKENDNCIGDFIWTAFDNMGEAGAGRATYGDDLGAEKDFCGAWPWISCWQGDCDMSGTRRPQSYFRKVMWGLDEGVHLFTLHPKNVGLPLHGNGWHWDDVKPDWTFGAEWLGKPVKLVAYADCDTVRFLVNGEAYDAPVKDLTAEAVVPYAPGEVVAQAIRDGRVAAEDRLVTVGAPVSLQLTPERASLPADGMSLCYVDIALKDAEGRDVLSDAYTVTAKVEGAATMAGLGSGNPCTTENYSNSRRLYEGHALLCLRSLCEGGTARVSVSAPGLGEYTLEIPVG